jgi:SRSO17 transposase
MLSTYRTDGNLYAIPQLDIATEDVHGFVEELKGFHEVFKDCFSRREPRENFFNYMVGQLSELERKSIEPMALNVENGSVRSLQRYISDAIWNEEKMLNKYHGLVAKDMGDPDGVVIFDETGFLKKGNDSIAVAKQYCGTAGKVDNCQVGVFTAYASPNGYALLDKRLFIPEHWFTKEYASKREKCQLPEDAKFKTKPQLAVDMFKSLQEQEIIPFKYVVADSIYGNSPDFINAVENYINVVYFVSIPSDTLCWLQQPLTTTKEYVYKKETRTKKILKNTENKPITVKALAKSIHNYFWYKRKVSEGTKGPIEYEFTKRRVILSKNGLPEKTVWLIIKRTIEANPTYYYYISNASSSTRLGTFVWLSGIRWAIEQCFEETKTELGMRDGSLRSEKISRMESPYLNVHVIPFLPLVLSNKIRGKSTCYYAFSAQDTS